MKKYFEYQDEKTTEKAFSKSLITSVVSVLLCLFALSSVTYAWFTGEISSNSNTLVSGQFDITISVSHSTDGPATADVIAVTKHPTNAGVYQCKLPSEGTYTVTLELTKGSTVKGHCVVKVGNDSPKHTDAIIGTQTENRENRPLTDPLVFTVEVTGPTTVTFEPRWGVVVAPDIAYQGTYSIT